MGETNVKSATARRFIRQNKAGWFGDLPTERPSSRTPGWDQPEPKNRPLNMQEQARNRLEPARNMPEEVRVRVEPPRCSLESKPHIKEDKTILYLGSHETGPSNASDGAGSSTAPVEASTARTVRDP